jgi:hypothetical protein
LRLRSACVEKSRSRMGEKFPAHQVIRLDCLLNVFLVNTQSYSHEHVLGSFNDFSVDFEQVGPFEGFKAEEIEGEVSFEIDGFVDFLVMLLDNVVNFVRKQRSVPSTSVFAIIKLVGDIKHGSVGFLS